jgi:molybdate transport system substrate-binding protein
MLSRPAGHVPVGDLHMTAEMQPWGSDWTVGLRVWVERAGQAVLGKGRLELLEGIGRWHSISAAARQMGMSYRRAWLLVQSLNEAAGTPLVLAATGGSHGGGAHLTPLGEQAVAIFRGLEEELRQTAAALLARRVQPAGPMAVHIAAAASLEEVIGQLLTDYALYRPAIRVRAVFGASDELADQLLGGGSADLFLSADGRQLDRLKAAGLLLPRSRAVLAENGLAAIAPAGRDVAVRRPTDLARPAVAHLALADPGSPLGCYTRSYLEHLGLYDGLLPRVVRADSARAVLAAVRSGQADVGLVYASDAAHAEGCRLLFRARRTPAPIRYEAGLVRRGRQAEAARELLHFLASARSARRFRRCGFIPARR